MAAPVLKLPASFREDLERLHEETQKFKSGKISAVEYRTFRVPRGIYEQREADTYMLRARCPAGIVLPDQMLALARVSRRYGNGVLHVTTRQDIQIHQVLLDNIYPALRELHEAGVSTKGGGGNTVRNITGCYDAGVCRDEAFDISPYVVGVTESLLPDPLSYQLPRKYKLAFSGCSRDCAGATVNDLGFIARVRDGQRGFTVYIGGGLGAASRVGELFEEFVPTEEISRLAEAVKRVFDKHGNRKNRHRARLRFLIQEIGLQRFRALYQRELADLPKPTSTEPDNLPPVDRELPVPDHAATRGPGFEHWKTQNVAPQKHAEFHLVQIPLTLGDITADRLEQLASVVQRYGEGDLRATQWQNLVLRWVHTRELPGLHEELSALGLANGDAPVLRNLVACTGASTCKLGICLSRGLAEATRKEISALGVDLNALGDLRIQISGCPNSCGRHPIADIGLFGAARRVQGHLSPHYVLQLGGRLGEGRSRLAQGETPVPAKNVPKLLAVLLRAYHESPHRPDFDAFLEAEGHTLANRLAAEHQALPAFQQDRDGYIDWGAREPFSLAGRGPGECGAGVFDLIEVDLANARDAIAAGRPLEAVVAAARSLLVTRGQQASSEAEALVLFTRHFIDEKLIDAESGETVGKASRLQIPSLDEASRFVAAIQKLYEGMDASLRFTPPSVAPPAPEPPASSAASTPAVATDREVDFRGVVCPLNYVRTKMALAPMKAGQTLAVLLDEPGARNVPPSVEKDGHAVVSLEQTSDHWRLIIRKAPG